MVLKVAWLVHELTINVLVFQLEHESVLCIDLGINVDDVLNSLNFMQTFTNIVCATDKDNL